MPLTIENGTAKDWKVRKIAVVGPGIVGMPMAAMLASARIHEGADEPAKVVVVQRNSPTSGWKVDAINAGFSSINGVEPELDDIVREAVDAGLLTASHRYSDVSDADVILVCTQTDKKGLEPDYGPLLSSLKSIATALTTKPAENIPLIIIESTLAPSTMSTIICDFFEPYNLLDGRDILLGFSPNRVMPGRLVHRVRNADKLVAGLRPITPQLIRRIYSKIVTNGTLHETNTLTAEIVKTTENAYRDVRIAYAAEVARFCDQHDIDFFQLREEVNRRLEQTDEASSDSNAIPRGGLLVPTVGVGGHCLPKDGILLLWRRIEHGDRRPNGLIEQARRINDASPDWTIALAEAEAGDLKDRNIAVLGAAYRFNSEDTRNSPSLVLAKGLIEKGGRPRIHDPYVHGTDQNVGALNLTNNFTNTLEEAMLGAEIVIACTAHRDYVEQATKIAAMSSELELVVDACNIWSQHDFSDDIAYTGIGRGSHTPVEKFVEFVAAGFRVVEHGFARELNDTVNFLNLHYARNQFNTAEYAEIQRLAGTCSTGCRLQEPIITTPLEAFDGFMPTMVDFATTKVLSAGS